MGLPLENHPFNTKCTAEQEERGLAKKPAIVQEIAVRHEVIILADSPGALVEVCGISLLERLLRTLQRLEVTKVVVLSRHARTYCATSHETVAASRQGCG